MNFLRSAVLLSAAFCVTTAQAEVVWTPENRWQVKGGVLAEVAGDGEKPAVRQTAQSMLNEAARLQAEGSFHDALNGYEEIIDLYPGSTFAAEALFQSSVIYRQRAQFEKSFKGLQELLRLYPDYPRFNAVIEEQNTVALAIKAGERPMLGGWLPWFKDYALGLNYFEEVQRNAPYGPLATPALLNKGELALQIDREEEAIFAFERIINYYPRSPLTPTAYLALAQTYAGRSMGEEWDQGSTVEALNYYNDFLALFPQDARAESALQKSEELRENLAKTRLDMGRFYYERRNNARAAAIFFNEAITAAPETATAMEARQLLAAIQSGKKADRSVMDWIFGRYPENAASEYIDAAPTTDPTKPVFNFTPASTTPQP